MATPGKTKVIDLAPIKFQNFPSVWHVLDKVPSHKVPKASKLQTTNMSPGIQATSGLPKSRDSKGKGR